MITQNCKRLRSTPEEIFAALNFEIKPAIAGLLREAHKKIEALQEYDKHYMERLEELQKSYEAENDSLLFKIVRQD